MREWFMVGCKLMGIYFLYWALASILSSVGFYAITSKSTFSEGPSQTEMLLSSAFAIISEIGFAIPLLFKTEWIADTLKLTGRIQNTSQSRSDRLLQPGITLLGIYIFCTKIGGLAAVYARSRKASNFSEPFVATQPKGISFSIDFIDPAVTLAISFLLIFGSKYITAFLTKEDIKATDQEAPFDRY